MTVRTVSYFITGLLAAFLIVTIAVYRERLEDAREQIEALRVRIAALEQTLESRPGKAYPDSLPTPLPGLSDREIRRLRDLGLENPARDLIIDLVRKPELIPREGVLGGEMGFYFPDRIWILTDRWALAYFEDGHIAGYLLLRYEVSDAGEISWEVIRSYIA